MALQPRPALSPADSQRCAGAWRIVSALQPSRASGQQAPPPFAPVRRFKSIKQTLQHRCSFALGRQDRPCLTRPGWRAPVAYGLAQQFGLCGCGAHSRQMSFRSSAPLVCPRAPRCPVPVISRTSLPICSASPRSSSLGAIPSPSQEQLQGGVALGCRGRMRGEAAALRLAGHHRRLRAGRIAPRPRLHHAPIELITKSRE